MRDELNYSLRNRLLRTKYSRWYLLAWGLLYTAFLILGVFLPGSVIVATLRISGITLCLVYALLYFRKDLWLMLALALTLLADIFLAINNASIGGVLVFCLAQFSHFMRLKKPPLSFCLGFYVSLLVVFSISLIIGLDPIYPLAAFYAAILLYNLYLSKKWVQKDDDDPAADNAFDGFLLFLCCDILVVMSFLSGAGILFAFIKPLANYLSWVFYLPSQILIANSSAFGPNSNQLPQFSIKKSLKKVAKSNKTVVK